ncbi:MAG: tRNA epoxyqueuosine(34) reductase QueG [Deltaproteobacteria bacterium]|nr:tRNA epoxyqueuosine(34) reductase QueG [Deltaproteobacteria bacterium]
MPNRDTPERMPGHLPAPWKFLGPIARDHGLAAIGVAPAGPAPQIAKQCFDSWIAAGYHAEMAYMTRYQDQRRDIGHPGILSRAKTVIVAALPYGNGAVQTGLWQHVASHARGRDYHATLKERLWEISRHIVDRFPASNCRVFVDTAPIMERTWALCSGIGHLGKNGLVLVPGIGGRVVLGEIVCASTPSSPMHKPSTPFELCGDCDLCIEACPTGALCFPAVVDASRCLSYWSIEQRGPKIPKEIAQQMSLVFGCDQCTSVCPHERPDTRTALDPPLNQGPSTLSLDQIAAMTENTLTKLIDKTPLARTGSNTILRNTRAVLKRLSLRNCLQAPTVE